jgi:hypothetical protein
MLGFYANFPENIQKAETFSVSISNKRLQQILVETLYRLNGETLGLEEIVSPSVSGCKVILEVGVAEDNDFNYLDTEERDRLLRATNKKPFQVMDFLWVIRYYNMQEEKKTHLRFDYYMPRLIFGKNIMEIQIFHEKGPMHTSPDDIVKLVADRINAALSKRALRLSEAT